MVIDGVTILLFMSFINIFILDSSITRVRLLFRRFADLFERRCSGFIC